MAGGRGQVSKTNKKEAFSPTPPVRVASRREVPLGGSLRSDFSLYPYTPKPPFKAEG
jgi:hypothetical protein